MSINSTADGLTPEIIISAAAFPAAHSSLKIASIVLTAFGKGRSLRVAFVTIPSVPSEPTIRRVRSYPVTPFTVCVPVSIISPVGSATSSPRI